MPVSLCQPRLALALDALFGLHLQAFQFRRQALVGFRLPFPALAFDMLQSLRFQPFQLARQPMVAFGLPSPALALQLLPGLRRLLANLRGGALIALGLPGLAFGFDAPLCLRRQALDFGGDAPVGSSQQSLPLGLQAPLDFGLPMLTLRRNPLFRAGFGLGSLLVVLFGLAGFTVPLLLVGLDLRLHLRLHLGLDLCRHLGQLLVQFLFPGRPRFCQLRRFLFPDLLQRGAQFGQLRLAHGEQGLHFAQLIAQNRIVRLCRAADGFFFARQFSHIIPGRDGILDQLESRRRTVIEFHHPHSKFMRRHDVGRYQIGKILQLIGCQRPGAVAVAASGRQPGTLRQALDPQGQPARPLERLDQGKKVHRYRPLHRGRPHDVGRSDAGEGRNGHLFFS